MNACGGAGPPRKVSRHVLDIVDKVEVNKGTCTSPRPTEQLLGQDRAPPGRRSSAPPLHLPQAQPAIRAASASWDGSRGRRAWGRVWGHMATICVLCQLNSCALHVSATTTAVSTTPHPGATPTPDFVTCGFECLQQAGNWSCNTTCGDGFRAGAEECDDGNDADGDGCSAGCAIEKYFNCSGEGDVALAPVPDGVEGAPSACLLDSCSDMYPDRLRIPEARAMATKVTVAVAVGVAGSIAANLAYDVIDGGPGQMQDGRQIFGRDGSSPLLMLIDQIQFINILGNVQGTENASETTSVFCDQLSWANYDIPIWGLIQNSSAAGGRRAETGDPETACSLQIGEAFGERLSFCIALLSTIFMARELCRIIYACRHPGKSPPISMHFPMWEGPVFMTQFYGLMDVCVQLLESDCAVWHAAGAATVAVIWGVVLIGGYRIIRCIVTKKTILWIETPVMSIQEFQDATKSMRAQEKLRCFVEWVYACRFEGLWVKKSDVAQHWAFLIDRYSKVWWSFFLYRLLVKCYFAVAVNVFPGATGGLMMMFLFFFDSLFSTLKSPYRDKWQASANDSVTATPLRCHRFVSTAVLYATLGFLRRRRHDSCTYNNGFVCGRISPGSFAISSTRYRPF